MVCSRHAQAGGDIELQAGQQQRSTPPGVFASENTVSTPVRAWRRGACWPVGFAANVEGLQLTWVLPCCSGRCRAACPQRS